MTFPLDTLIGLSGRVQMTVMTDDTAAELRSGDVPTLSTSRLVALCEQAAVEAVRDALPAGWTAVAMRVRIDHLAPTQIGTEVTAEASLEQVDGRRLLFTVSASDAAGLVGAGKLALVAVDRARFLEKVR